MNPQFARKPVILMVDDPPSVNLGVLFDLLNGTGFGEILPVEATLSRVKTGRKIPYTIIL